MAAELVPPDVIALICAHFPLRPRLFALARVCRRWRMGAYQSITSLEPHMSYLGPLSRYPNLTVCNLSAKECVPSSWTAEERARIRRVRFHRVPAVVLSASKFSSLTCLEACLDEVAAVALPEVVLGSARTLAHLKIVVGSVTPGSIPPITTSLPALRSIDIWGNISCADPLLYFGSLLSQLTALKIAFDKPMYCALQLPRLRLLTVHDLSLNEKTVAWVTAMPSLTALKLAYFTFDTVPLRARSDVSQPLIALSHLLVSVALSAEADPGGALIGCPKLRKIYLGAGATPLLRALRHLAPHITSMHIPSVKEAEADTRYVMQHFTMLKKLHIEPRSQYDALLRWHLPHLRTLVVREQPINYVTMILRTFPDLEELRVLAFRHSPVGDLAAFVTEVQAADRRGMRRIVLVGCTHDLRQLRGTLRWLAISVEWAADNKFPFL